MNVLRPVSFSKVKSIIPDRVLVRRLQNNKETVYFIDSKSLVIKTDDLLKIELALRKCKRLGVFKKNE